MFFSGRANFRSSGRGPRVLNLKDQTGGNEFLVRLQWELHWLLSSSWIIFLEWKYLDKLE